MDKKNYMSKEEQMLWEFIGEKDIITTELVGFIFPDFSKNKINKLLHSLIKKDYIRRAERGFYYNPKYLGDYKKLALRIKPGYIGLSSALKYHGLTDYEDFTIFVMTRSTYKEIKLENYTIKYLPAKLYSGYTKKDGITVSKPEKTFFDCFLNIRYVSYPILTKAIYYSKPDWKKLLEYFEHAPLGSRQKAGYVLELMREETDYHIPEYVLNNLRKGIKFPVKLAQNNNRSILNKKWMVQDNLGKTKILGWWLQ